MSSVWQALLANFALIAVLLMAWEVISDYASDLQDRWRAHIFGIIMGLGALGSMFSAAEIVPGVFFDLRAVLIASAGFFGGLPAAVVSAVIAIGARIAIGGQGLLGGIASIVIAFVMGLMLGRIAGARSMRFKDVVVFAILVPITSFSGYMILPEPLWTVLLEQTGLPVTLFSFISALFIASALLRDRRRRELSRGNLIYRSMVDHLPDCLNVRDVDGRFIAANPQSAATMGAKSADLLIGRTDFDFFPPEIARQMRADEEAMLAEGHARRFEQSIRLADGSHCWMCTLKAPLRNDSDQIIGIITHSRDITEEKRNAEIKNEFISTVSHELRTPLTSIRGSLGLIAAGAVGQLPPKIDNLVRIAHANSERLVLLINDILDMEKIESGKMVFEMSRQSLRPFLEQAISSISSYLPEKGVKIVLVDDAPGAKAIFDQDRLHQAIANLLSNAIKFSPEDEVVLVRLDRTDGKVRISVSDRGAGIPDVFQHRIFGKFEQADPSSTREKGGTGLGLSISKAIMERMGGGISFETTPGYGTTFQIHLPEIGQPENVFEPKMTLAAGTDRGRVLICEDEPDIAVLIALLLFADGFSSDVAPDIESAKSLLRKRTYVALTLDIKLAGESGTDLFEHVRTSDHNRDIPVVVISAVADETRSALSGAAVGIVDWLSKPIDVDRLHAAMMRITTGYQDDRPRVLHVENDEDVLEVISTGLGPEVSVSYARTLRDARHLLAEEAFDLIILDVKLPDGCGLELLPDLPPQMPVIVFSAVEVDEKLAARVKAVMTKTRTSEFDVARAVKSLLPTAAEQRKSA